MTSWAQERRLELVFDKTLDTIHQRMQKVSKKDRKALRREFQGWFSNDWNELDILWLEHYRHGKETSDAQTLFWRSPGVSALHQSPGTTSDR